MSTSTTAPRRRWPWIAAAVAVLAIVALAFGMHAALRAIERDVAEAFGPGATIAAIRASTTAVELEGVVIPGGEGWPVAESLRAERVRLVPTWGSLLSGPIEIARIEVEAPYVSMLRTRDGGLRALPGLLATTPSEPKDGATHATPSDPQRSVSVGEIRITGGTLELFDATVAKPPWKTRLIDVSAELRDVANVLQGGLPTRSPQASGPSAQRGEAERSPPGRQASEDPKGAGRMPFELRGVLDGPQRDGRVEIRGWIVAATRDLEVRADLAAIDLLALEPYLIEATKARLERGTLDLALTAMVTDHELHAPGHLVLSDLAFASGGRPSARVLGVPRNVLFATLQVKGGRIALDFSLDGRVDDPQFSLNETFATRVAVALAKELGVSVGGLALGTIGIGLEGLEGAGKAAGGAGTVLKKLLPGR